MVTRYHVKPFFKEQCGFSPFQGKEYKMCTKRSKMYNLLYHSLNVQRKKFNNYPPFPVRFSILVKSTSMAATIDDVTGLQRRPQPIIYDSSRKADHRLSLKVTSKYQNITKTGKGVRVHQAQPTLTPTHHPSYHGRGGGGEYNFFQKYNFCFHFFFITFRSFRVSLFLFFLLVSSLLIYFQKSNTADLANTR